MGRMACGMVEHMKITNAMVLLSTACDKVFLYTNLPCPYVQAFMPNQQPLMVSFDATYDTGIEYVKKNFGIDPEIVNTRP